MINLIPMGGKSSRFFDAGYKENKATLPVTSFINGKRYPMALASILSIPWITKSNNKIICINDIEHSFNGLESKIIREIPEAIFIHDHVKLDQAFGCFLAREYLKKNEELFIGASDCAFNIDMRAFSKMKKNSDVIIFSQKGTLPIKNNPFDHSWLIKDKRSSKVNGISFKQPISTDYLDDHATTGMFWFKNANLFLQYLECMIVTEWKISRTSKTKAQKFYIDKLIDYFLKDKLNVKNIDVDFICWGTPLDYENYESTIQYWKSFKKKLRL